MYLFSSIDMQLFAILQSSAYLYKNYKLLIQTCRTRKR